MTTTRPAHATAASVDSSARISPLTGHPSFSTALFKALPGNAYGSSARHLISARRLHGTKPAHLHIRLPHPHAPQLLRRSMRERFLRSIRLHAGRVSRTH